VEINEALGDEHMNWRLCREKDELGEGEEE
jgi:hypothetical protein